jgi:diguanylate cyclase (GGDEF)-like protein
MIEHYAYYDRLTDLPNRNLLYDRLQQAILAAHRENKLAALLIADLDRFKEINDALGHQFGDQLLHQIGPRLKATLRESDTVARLGGDEFAMLLPSVADAGAAIEVASKVLKALEDPFLIAGLNIQIEASIGIALFPEHGIDADTLFKRADVAMYMAKETRNGYALYSAENDPNSSHRITLMGELRRAIVEDQLFLLYQPKIDLKTGHVSGVEALVRWRHPQAGIRMPDNFIPPAERTGLITPLTVWVLDKALRQCHAWHQEGLNLGMAVNLSRRNLQAQELPDQIAGMLEANGVSPADLELEITESSIMANPVRAMEVLSRMTSMGLQFSLDDFGTGHSSLAYLKKLPVNTIKIDKSFVTKMVAQAEDVAIIRLIIDLGHILGLKVVAEGVEDRVTLDKLIALGCDMAQGYFICRPISAEELTRWLRSQPDPLNGGNSRVQRNLNPEH